MMTIQTLIKRNLLYYHFTSNGRLLSDNHIRLTGLVCVSQSDFCSTIDDNRERPRHTHSMRGHHQYVAGISLEEKAQPKLLVATSVIVTGDQVTRQIEWIESVLI